MDKKKKILMGVVAAAIIIVIVVVAAVTIKNKSEDGSGTTTEQTTGIEDVVTFTDETKADDSEKNKDNDKQNNKDGEDDTTNFWDNVEIIEQTDSTEVKTDENGETVTEAYPGEGDGWSPIVSPDDLKEDK